MRMTVRMKIGVKTTIQEMKKTMKKMAVAKKKRSKSEPLNARRNQNGRLIGRTPRFAA